MRRTMILLMAGAFALAACSSGPPVRISSTGSIKIVEPKTGARIEGDSFTIKVDVEGATILEKAQKEIRPDTGHVHILVDGAVVNLLAGLESTVEDLEPGTHLIEAEFTAADHGGFNPRVLDRITVRVVG